MKYGGGWWNIMAVMIIFIVFVLCEIKIDYIIGLWASDESI
jgi:hypothetical protein